MLFTTLPVNRLTFNLKRFSSFLLVDFVFQPQPILFSQTNILVCPSSPDSLTLDSSEQVEAVQGNMLLLSGVDLVDGTPVLDIKPYLPNCDSIEGAVVPNWVMVHLNYLEAGADIIITASYQATIQGFEAKGFSREQSETLLKKSVEIALEARDMYYERCSKSSCEGIVDGRILKVRPILVAASVGSYGAYLADGSEYSGDYGDAMTLEALKDFHRRRVQVLSEAGPDLEAFETVPNKIEAQAYAELLEEEDIKIPAWFSFSSKDGINVVSGDSLLQCASIAESCMQVVAVGINCTPPRFIHELILAIKKALSGSDEDGWSDSGKERVPAKSKRTGAKKLECVRLLSYKVYPRHR